MNMSTIKNQIRKAAKTLKDKLKNDKHVREGMTIILNAVVTIALRALQRK